MAKKPKKVYKSSEDGLVPVQPETVSKPIQVYKDGSGTDRLSITREVREHPEAQRARMEDEPSSRYDELLHSIYDAVMITDLDGNISEVNVRAEHNFMWSKEELCEMNIVDMISGADEELLKMLQSSVSGKKYTVLEAICVRGDKSRFNAEIVVNRLGSQGNGALYFFIRDVTLRKKAEEELKNVNDKLVEAEKLKARLDTLSTLSYELNNPLQILNSMAELNKNKEYKKQLNRIISVLDKLRRQEPLETIVDEECGTRYDLPVWTKGLLGERRR